MDKVSKELRERIASRYSKELQDMMDRIKEEPPGVGNCMPVIIDTDFAANNKIGTFGRMTLEEEKPVIRVAPLDIDRVPKYKVDIKTNLEWGLAVTHDKRTVENGTQLCREPHWPKLEKPDNLPRKKIERTLFKHLRSMFNLPIMLVNPDNSSILGLSKAGGGFATLTNRHDEEMRLDFKAALDGIPSKNVTWRDPDKFDGVICYLGSGEVKEYIGSWIRLIPSPFTYSSSRTAVVTGEPGSRTWVMTEMRGRDKSRVVKVTWSESDPFITYNSNTVASNFHTSDSWLIQTTFDIGLREAEDKRILSCPVYIDNPSIRPMKRVNEVVDGKLLTLTVYSEKESDEYIVADIEGPGTYFSRRSRVKLPDGYKWCTYRRSPTGVTITSMSRTYLMDSTVKCFYVRQQDSEFIGLGGSYPLLNPKLVKKSVKERTTIQTFPELILDPGEHYVWEGKTLFSTWRGEMVKDIMLPDVIEPGAILFEHTRGVMRGTKGEVRRTMKLCHGGLTFVVVNGYSPGQNWTYSSSELDLYNVVQIKRFFFSGLPSLSDDVVGFRGKRAVPIQEVALNYILRHWEDSGFTLSNIYHSLPNYESLSAISQNVAANRDILTWLDGTYVDIRNIKIKFDGIQRDGFEDGKEMSVILYDLAVQGLLYMNLSVFPSSNFFKLCRANGIMTDFAIREDGYRFRLRWPRYYKSHKVSRPESAEEVF